MTQELNTTKKTLQKHKNIKCFNCMDHLGVYEHNSLTTHECLQIHICLKCKMSGVQVEVFVINNRNERMEIK